MTPCATVPAAVAGLFLTLGPVWADPLAIVRVVDGDTVELADGEHLRLCCADTPESWRPQCPAEEAAGDAAADAVAAWIAAADHAQVVIDFCCDRYGRPVGDVLLDGVSLSQRLVAAGLGVPYDGGQRPDWCALLN